MEKKLRLEFEQLKAGYPEAEVELWCEDEHRIEPTLCSYRPTPKSADPENKSPSTTSSGISH